MKKILVTGGAGYTGSMLVRELLSRGFLVTVFDLFLYGEQSLPKHINLIKVRGDVRNEELLKSILSGHDAVIHLAFISNDPGCIIDPKIGKEINYECFEPLVRNSKEAGIKHFIFPSSCSVYGQNSEFIVEESSPLNPLTNYAICKIKCEEVLSKYLNDDFNVTILRPATVYGFSFRQRFDLFFNSLINQAYFKQKIMVQGPHRIRPSINILDLVRAYLLILESPVEKVKNKIFNIAYDNETVLESASRVKNVFRSTCIDIVETNDGRSYSVSSEKIRNELDFSAIWSKEDGIEALTKVFKNGQMQDSFFSDVYYNNKLEAKLLA